MLVDTIVIAGDAACPNIDVTTNGCITQIREVAGLRPCAHGGFLGLNEVTNLYARGKIATGADARERSELAVLGDHGAFDHRICLHLHARTELR